MIKVITVIGKDPEKKKLDVGLKADTKTEVTDAAEIVGMPSDHTIGFNSWIVTAEGDVGMRKSDGTWNWLE